MFTGVEGGSKEVAVELHLRRFRALGTRVPVSAIRFVANVLELTVVAATDTAAVSYISQAADLNFLLYLHIWSWYARRSGASWGYRDRVERRKTFQASSQDDKPSIRRFLR